MCARMLLSVLPFLRFGQKGRRLVKDRGTGHCPVCLDVVLDTSKIILLFRVTYLLAIPLVNDISILYVFQPCFLLLFNDFHNGLYSFISDYFLDRLFYVCFYLSFLINYYIKNCLKCIAFIICFSKNFKQNWPISNMWT